MDHRGVVLAFSAAAIMSLNGLILRSIDDASVWQVVFYRQAGLLVTMSTVFVARHRGHVLAESRTAWLSAIIPGVLLATATIMFIVSLSLTTVANTAFMMSATPLVSALLGWLVLRERVQGRTWVAIVAAAIGMTVMVAGGIRSGALAGNLTALSTCVSFASFVVAIRRARRVDMTFSVSVAALVSLLLSGAVTNDLAVSVRDAALCLVWGGIINCAGQLFFVMASRRLAAAELALITLAEFVLAPTWVWIVVDEVPSRETLVGGSIVLAAIGFSALGNLRRAPAQDKEMARADER